jgi:hypothetical protein
VRRCQGGERNKWARLDGRLEHTVQCAKDRVQLARPTGKSPCSKAYSAAAGEMIQLRGGIGVT